MNAQRVVMRCAALLAVSSNGTREHPDLATAYHEAGHAVAAAHLQMAFASIALSDDGMPFTHGIGSTTRRTASSAWRDDRND